jgi:hypothetical protein
MGVVATIMTELSAQAREMRCQIVAQPLIHGLGMDKTLPCPGWRR